VPSCANDLFNNDIVRGEWGFDGFIVSVCHYLYMYIPAFNHILMKCTHL
jgi:hypothetical protein